MTGKLSSTVLRLNKMAEQNNENPDDLNVNGSAGARTTVITRCMMLAGFAKQPAISLTGV